MNARDWELEVATHKARADHAEKERDQVARDLKALAKELRAARKESLRAQKSERQAREDSKAQREMWRQEIGLRRVAEFERDEARGWVIPPSVPMRETP